MKIKGKYSESEKLHFVILGVAAVLSVVVFFVVLALTGGGFSLSGGNAAATTTTTTTAATEPEPAGYEPEEELKEEMRDAVIDLIPDNYTVLRLYYIRGLNHKDEPYGNAPEDGYYTVDSETYTSLEQLEEIVDRTFTKEFAANIKTDPLGYGAIYKTRSNGTLGIIANFTPMPYDRSWENPDYDIEPLSDTECDIKVYIHEKSEGEPLVTIDGHMTKTSSGWRLTSILF